VAPGPHANAGLGVVERIYAVPGRCYYRWPGHLFQATVALHPRMPATYTPCACQRAPRTSMELVATWVSPHRAASWRSTVMCDLWPPDQAVLCRLWGEVHVCRSLLCSYAHAAPLRCLGYCGMKSLNQRQRAATSFLAYADFPVHA
jgi:hypothetical protein